MRLIRWILAIAVVASFANGCSGSKTEGESLQKGDYAAEPGGREKL
ncbi:MAG: hypothetical protein SNJ74_00715 [Fimbriimonadaceae bacterium]